jgi:rod shape-determining protein MreD
MLIGVENYFAGVRAPPVSRVKPILSRYRVGAFYGLFLVFLILPMSQAATFSAFPSLYHGLLFYWVAQRRGTVSHVFLFVVGALLDTMMMRFIGSTFLEMTLFVALCENQGPIIAQSSPWMRWFIFVVFLLVYTLCVYCVMTLMNQAGALSLTLLSWAGVSASYPLILFVTKSVFVEPVSA